MKQLFNGIKYDRRVLCRNEENMLGDIITDHKERMLNIKKYYPFFKLSEISFAQIKEGRYEVLDMGYIVMAVLRFFIEKNNFKEKDVTYDEYLVFITQLLKRDFGINESYDELKEIGGYIFEKIKNDGHPFEYTYYDPVERKKRISRMKILESGIRQNTVWYRISSEAVEFYLDTKEIKEESRISVSQLLLEKMIRSQNYKGGTQVITRINEEVNALWLRKNEVTELLSKDIFAGIEKYEEFVKTGMQWFSDEEKLFRKNKELIEKSLEKMESEDEQTESYYRTLKEIYELENQLNVAMNRHAQLLKACTDMQKLTDEAIMKGKLGSLRSHIDFQSVMAKMIKSDNADNMAVILSSMFGPHIKKKFNINFIDDALTVKMKEEEIVEKVDDMPVDEIVFDDEIEEQRIKDNYIFIMKNLICALNQKEKITLSEFNKAMERAYSENILKNADYYSFFVNLCQKTEYHLGKASDEKNFFDAVIKEFTESLDDNEKISFKIMSADEKITKDDVSQQELEIVRI